MKGAVDTAITALVVLLCLWVLLLGDRAHSAVGEAATTVRASTDLMQDAERTINSADRMIRVDAPHATVRLQFDHAPAWLLICASDNGRETCGLPAQWREWLRTLPKEPPNAR